MQKSTASEASHEGLKPLLVITVCVCLCFNAVAQTLHVSTNGNDALPGTSWGQAKRTIGSAIIAASNSTAIWVGRGTYHEHITLKPNVELYGGFDGSEQALSERDFRANVSAIWGTTNKAVVVVTNSGPGTRLDGLTIGGGNGIHGGGIQMVGSAPVVANCTLRNNMTDGAGAGISIWGFFLVGSTEAYFPRITNNIIVENQSINDEGDGAGIAVIGSSPVIAWNVIARNTATRNGGGIACWRYNEPLIANNFIQANSASYDELTASGGGGGVFASATDLDGRPISGAISAPHIINNVIAANGGYDGGGITLVDSLLGAATLANNTIVANNGAGVFWANTSPTNDNNLVAFNTRGFTRSSTFTNEAVLRCNNVFGNSVLGAPADYHVTPNRTGTAGNISVDPIFANPGIGDYHLQPDSPCVDSGSTALAPTAWPDLDRQARVQGWTVDIGADESNGTGWDVRTPVAHVSPTGDNSDGLSWATAKQTIAGGIAAAALTGGEVWVARGTYVEHIRPPAFVHIYGGFNGGETNRSQSNPMKHPTILDGGGMAPVVYFRNAGYRVSGLEGFTVQGGGIYTSGDVFHPDLTNRFGGRGGGIYCRVSGPIIAGNLIRSNSLGSPFNTWESYGGGIYAYLSHAQITDNLLTENEVLTRGDGDGGGIYCFQCIANIENNTFRYNHAANGAAIYANLSQLRVARNSVQTNLLYTNFPSVYMGSVDGALTFRFAHELLLEANILQGNIANFGAGICLRSPYSARVQNNLIIGNLAWDFSGFGGGGQGGGLACDVGVNATGSTIIVNNTFSGNSAPPTILGHFGGAVALTLYTNNLAIVANNILASNSSGIWRYPYLSHQAVLRNNCLNNSNANYINLMAGPGDIGADPRFLNAAGHDFRLQPTSPCVDAGTPNQAPPYDKDGVPRPLDGLSSGTGAYDIGACEFVSAVADTDHDGMADLPELIAGTSPADTTSVLKLESRLEPAQRQVVLRWPSVTGRSYSIEFKSLLGSTSIWETLEESIPGSGSMLERRDSVSIGPHFYRLTVRGN